ncbi:hypothetical protein D9615_002357 [Tricholomella constricta]|uniref:Distal membrane-arm assembly complex protein 1-like domain-containing protein n=1 Tax=Tricholomella constricta TaxID=117010 RepID=A0A8H5HM37_9AGAR|nr:hypothetical protein D9615_002357 [Tricholomella constricta]
MSDAQDAIGIPKASLPAQHNASRPYKDCLSCRIIGTGTLAGVGSYAIWQSRAAALGSPGQKKIVAGLGIGGVVRWFQ